MERPSDRVNSTAARRRVLGAQCRSRWHHDAMRTTIDAAGRIIVPKALRDELGLSPGRELEVRARDGGLTIDPLPTEVSLVRRGGILVAKPKTRLPRLTQEAVRDALEGTRR
jgi:AbrB family looped-hinge helix DNA binding protein